MVWSGRRGTGGSPGQGFPSFPSGARSDPVQQAEPWGSPGQVPGPLLTPAGNGCDSGRGGLVTWSGCPPRSSSFPSRHGLVWSRGGVGHLLRLPSLPSYGSFTLHGSGNGSRNGNGKNGFLYIMLYCSHYSGTGTGNGTEKCYNGLRTHFFRT